MAPVLRRLVLVFALVPVLLGALASAAAAHATFSGAPGAVAAGSELTLTMDVPHERDDTTYNVGVVVAMPAGWAARSCEAQATWTCRLDASGARATVQFTKDAGAAPGQDETFRFAVRAAPSAGAYSFPTVQTYNTGEAVRWIGAAGTAEPAPVLQVTGSAPAPSETPTTPPVTATSPPAATPTTRSVPATEVPATPVPVTTTAATTGPSAPGAGTSTTVVTSASGASGAVPTSGVPTSGGPTATAGASDAGDSGGSGTTVAIVVGLLVVVGGGIGVAALRRRNRGTA